MSRQTVNPTLLRLGLIAALALSLIMGFGGAQPALADPVSPLAVTKSASPSPVASGAEITYTIAIINTGGAKVDKVVMTDQLNGVGGIGTPPQLVLTSTRGSCSQSGLKVTCNIGTIPGGGSATITIRGIVTAANGTTLNNTASVTGTKSAQNFTTTASVQTLVQNSSALPPGRPEHQQVGAIEHRPVEPDDLHSDGEQHRQRERHRRPRGRHPPGWCGLRLS